MGVGGGETGHLEERRLEWSHISGDGSRFERPRSPKKRSGAEGRSGGSGGEGLRATLIRVSWGQIIYHPVQTNTLLDSLSERGGRRGGEGRGV